MEETSVRPCRPQSGLRTALRHQGATVLFSWLWLGLAPAAGAQPLLEAPWVGFDTGAWGEGFGPRSMVAGDLNGDGSVDVVVGQGHFGSPGVSVLLGDGAGAFSRPTFHALPFSDVVGDVALSDVDGDLDLDVLATVPDGNGLSDRLLLWRNDGSGRLAPPQTFLAGPGPLGMAVADFNRDGHEDVVTADYGWIGQGTTVSLLIHDGGSGAAAGFEVPGAFEGGVAPRFLEVGDIDGDGWMDLAVARTEANAPVVSILFNDGSGGFLPPTTLSSGPRGAPVVALGDLDNDGDLDLVTGWQDNSGSVSFGMVRVYRNDGAGGFGGPSDHRLDAFAEDPEDIELADMDGDGFLDILTANPNGRLQEGWRVLLSDGGSDFGAPGVYPSSQNTETLLVVQIDGDCDLDVLALARFSNALTVHVNLGAGEFYLPEPHPVAAYARDMDAADVDFDGDLDLVVASGPLEIFLNEGAGTFSPAQRYLPTGTVSSVKFRDMDGDGDADILWNRAPGGGFSVGRNNGDGTFAPPETWSLDPCSGEDVDAFDLDADGDLDVVMSGCAQGSERYLFVARNDGDAQFMAMSRVATLVTTRGVGAAHLDGDEHLDLVAIEAGFGLATYAGDGALGFATGLISSASPYLFTLADFDGDGIMDAGLTIPSDAAGTDLVGIAVGLGDGSFADPSLVNGSSVMESLRVSVDLDAGDLDGDGRADLVVTQYSSNDISVFRGNGAGDLKLQARYGANITPSSSLLADVTGDGLVDVVTNSAEVGPPALGRSLIVLAGIRGRSAGGGGPAEIDPRSVRVRKTGASSVDIDVRFDLGGIRPPQEHVNVYRGTITALHDEARYDHGALPSGCAREESPFVDGDAATIGLEDWYYLVVRRCASGSFAAEGPYGWAFDGSSFLLRLDAAMASGLPCP